MASTRLEDCHPDLQERWKAVQAAYEAAHPGQKLILTCTYRDREEQFRLYQKGRVQVSEGVWAIDKDPKTSVVTNVDGYQKLSRHNFRPALALDFAVVLFGKISWDEREYRPVGALAREQGLVWGGDWKSIRDCPHVELANADALIKTLGGKA